ncbi:hypothetical protein NHQ30_008422 [Ciborinia camelliae]|nr:hypothetical protein NHQ30_008422 [Ciborinia camelliae]
MPSSSELEEKKGKLITTAESQFENLSADDLRDNHFTYDYDHYYGIESAPEDVYQAHDSQLMYLPADDSKITSATNYFRNLEKIAEIVEKGRYVGGIPIKVAILDTGIHPSHPVFQSIREYKNFINPSSGPEDYESTRHGSSMVYLLHKVAPSVEIYFARVFGNGPIKSDSAIPVANALIHARDVWKVDIISMSFGFKDEKKEFLKAINDTLHTLIFASASNYGANENPPIRFPARVKDRVICLNSADGNGSPSDCNPPANDKRENFTALGEGVRLSEEVIQPARGTNSNCVMGSSIATVITAGIAALVLEFARQEDYVPIRCLESIKTHSGMSAVLRAMTKGGEKGGFNFIAPGKVFLNCNSSVTRERISKALEERNH